MSLIDKYPVYWLASEPTVGIINAIGGETDELRASLSDLLAQCNVETATWGLALWERQLGIDTDVEKPYDYRRSRILSKLRGTGTVTVAMIKNMAESFSNGEVDVIEDAANYHFDVKFVGTMGIPPNMDDLTAAIEEIRPAHLTYAYIYVYRTWQMAGDRTWAQASAYTWQELKEGTL